MFRLIWRWTRLPLKPFNRYRRQQSIHAKSFNELSSDLNFNFRRFIESYIESNFFSRTFIVSDVDGVVVCCLYAIFLSLFPFVCHRLRCRLLPVGASMPYCLWFSCRLMCFEYKLTCVFSLSLSLSTSLSCDAHLKHSKRLSRRLVAHFSSLYSSWLSIAFLP